ncbi:unnamed protein product, partial [Umbelopsis sp. WA50703]
MDVDEPGLHMEMMDLDPWWEPFAEPSLQEEATACPCARDNEPEQKGSPPPVPVQPVRFDPPPTCVSNHRVLKPLPARRKVLANLSSPFNYSLPAVTTGASGGSNRGTGSKSSSSQQRVVSQQSLPTASVKVESRKCKERSDQSQAQEKIPSPFGSPRPMELVPPPQEGLTQLDRELLSLLDEVGEIESAPMPPAAENHNAQDGLSLDDLEEWINRLKPEDETSELEEQLTQIEYILNDGKRQATPEEENPLSAGP